MKTFTHRFVKFMPEKLEEGVIYVSVPYALVSHRCACGCGEEVVTPLSPRDWQLIFNGDTVSLYPSIGNWNFHCRSHYWIEQNRIEWASSWSSSTLSDRPNEEFEDGSAAEGGKKLSVTDRLLARLKRRWF